MARHCPPTGKRPLKPLPSRAALSDFSRKPERAFLYPGAGELRTGRRADRLAAIDPSCAVLESSTVDDRTIRATPGGPCRNRPLLWRLGLLLAFLLLGGCALAVWL